MSDPLVTEADMRRWAPYGLVALAFILMAFGAFTEMPEMIVAGLVSALGALLIYHDNKTSGVAQSPISTTPASDGERTRNLQNYLTAYLATRQTRIESVTEYSAVVVTGQKVNHVLHLLISLLLCGIWLPIWLLISLTGGEKRIFVSVDECGNTTAG